MNEKPAAVVFCLAFAVVFGAGGAFATWAIAGTIMDGLRARDWVLVKADVDSFNDGQVSYRYSFKGREFTGDRLGTSVVGGNDNIDEWHEEMAERIAAARNASRPITVFVNPENPAESMVDRRIRWNFLVFLLPFSLGFGGVGVGALWFLARTLSREGGSEESRAKRGARNSDARTGVLLLWVLAFFWNVISFPIAILAIPQVIQSEEWIGLAVLLFPLIGIGLLWAAISATIAHLRRGRMANRVAVLNR